MKNYKSLLFTTILLLVLSIETVIGQHDALVRHWSFDGDKSTFENIIVGEKNEVSLNTGISGKGITLSSNYLEIKDGVDLMKDFTLSFWIKSNEIERNQTLFYQFRQLTGSYDVRNFIRLEIENGEFVLKSEKGEFSLRSFDVTTDRWYAISYMYDGTNTKLYLQGKMIYTTDESLSFYQKSYQSNRNRLFIGRSHTSKSQFKGIVDEIKVFQKAIEDEVVTTIFEEHEANVMLAGAKIEVEKEEATAPPTPKKEEVAVVEKPKSYQYAPDKAPKDEIIYIDEYQVLDPLIVRTTGITLEYYQIKGDKNIELAIVHNDDLGKPLKLTKEKKIKRVALNIGNENSLTFEGFQLKRNQKCRVRVNVKSGNNIIASYDIDLDKNNVVLPIAYLRAKDKNPKNHKIITVNSKNIQIQVKDNSKVDGDVITIKQEGATILDTYSLTDKLKNVDVLLKENLHNEFSFIPVDMGKSSGENTALVLILVDDEVIYDFSLRSIDKNRPARLTIIHEDF